MADQDLFAGFNDVMAKSVQAWHVPGCAVTAVRGNETVLCETSGVRDVEQRLPFLTGTLFEIASLTKAFTAACLGILVDRRLIDFDQPVRAYLPGFTLFDAAATDTVTITDLLSHSTGLPRHDKVFAGHTELTRQQIMESLRWLEPSCKPRTRFQYQNMMYAVAGLIIEAVDGRPWEDFVQAELLDPLGMNRTRMSRKAGLATGDYAMPYTVQDDKPIRMGIESLTPGMRPAGGIISTAEDMGRWLILQLGDGTIDGNRILSTETFHRLHTPIIDVTGDERSFVGLPEFGDGSYCLGWNFQSYRGHTMLHHSGGNDGLTSTILLFPDDRVGISVLTNSDDTMQRLVPALTAADLLLNLEPLPWNERWLQRVRRREAQTPPASTLIPVDPGRPLSAYVGNYAHPAYGQLVVTATPAGLRITLHGLNADLTGSAPDAFAAAAGPILDPGDTVHFAMDAAGCAASVAAPLEHAVAPILFVRTQAA
jgi:CubicO group peptidase (beta-lactamase class C family)